MRKPVIQDRVYRYLLQKLANGQWMPGRLLPSLRQISAELRISHQSVKFVWEEAARCGLMTRSPRGTATIAANAREIAREQLQEITRKAATRHLAICLPAEFALPLDPKLGPLQAQLVNSVISAATARNFACHVIQLSATDQLQQANAIVHKFDAAFIVELAPHYIASVTCMVECGLPTVTYQRRLAGINVPSLVTDDAAAARRLVEVFAAAGHRNMSLITTLHHDTIMDERFVARRGWVEKLESMNLLEHCVMPIMHFRTFQNTMLMKLLTLRPKITALAVATPGHVRALARLLELDGMRIPQDMSLAAMSTMAHINLPPDYPPITDFELDWQRTGQCAIEMIEKIIAGELATPNIRIPLTLNLTESIGPPPADA